LVLGQRGIAIPIDLSHILAIVPTPKRVLAVAIGGTWFPKIEYQISPSDNHVDLNHILAMRATRFLFGPDTNTVASYLFHQQSLPPMEPEQIGFISGYYAIVHDMDWHNLISALSIPPKMDGQFMFIDLLSDPTGISSRPSG
jgi:hypothetical protein